MHRRPAARKHAIPRNGHLSNGRMFEEQRFDCTTMTADCAKSRQRWERLFELTEIKGQSESDSRLSPTDEYASRDLWDAGNLIGVPKKPGMIRDGNCREALKSGLTIDEDDFWGKSTSMEPRPGRWKSGHGA
jgi:hypothetical protein